jgi:hypothetical protein
MKTNTQNTNSGLKIRSEQLSTVMEGGANTAAPTERRDNRLPVDYEQRRRNRTLPSSQVLSLLVTTSPDAYRLAEVVGKWVWVQFNQVPAAEIRQQLSQLGFHWNRARHAWQHPCGLYRDIAATVDPRQKYGSYFAADLNPA